MQIFLIEYHLSNAPLGNCKQACISSLRFYYMIDFVRGVNRNNELERTVYDMNKKAHIIKEIGKTVLPENRH